MKERNGGSRKRGCQPVSALFLPNSAPWALGNWLDLIDLSGAGPRAESRLRVIGRLPATQANQWAVGVTDFPGLGVGRGLVAIGSGLEPV
jgi:hypothetical protein